MISALKFQDLYPLHQNCRDFDAFKAFVAVLLLLAGMVCPACAQDAAQAKLRTTPLEIVSVTGIHRFTVEMAVDDQSRAIGLMHRREMAEDEGMLFDFGRDDIVAMWMKNTVLSLDMVFIMADGTISNIAENTKPFSLDTVTSRGRVRSVLEVKAGTTRRLGLKAGDKVRNIIFGNLS